MKNEYSALVSGVCFVIVAVSVLWVVAYETGRVSGASDTAESMAATRSGQLPVGVPVLLYWTRDDGTIRAESAMKTDYAGVLPFSVSGKAVPYEQYSGYDYWSKLDISLAGVKP